MHIVNKFLKIKIYNKMIRITVAEIPLGCNLEGKKLKYLHSNMGHLYILFCRDLDNGNEYSIIITKGFIFKYLESIRRENNLFKFNIKRILDVESGKYIISINEEHNWIMLH